MISPTHLWIRIVTGALIIVGSSCKPHDKEANTYKPQARVGVITIELILPAPDDCVAEVRDPATIDVLLRAIARVKQARYDGRSERALGAADGKISANGETVVWQGPTVRPHAKDHKSYLNYVLVPELGLLSSAINATDIAGNCTNWQKLVSAWEAKVTTTNKPSK